MYPNVIAFAAERNLESGPEEDVLQKIKRG